VTEEDFQAQVVAAAHLFGWHHLHVRRTIGRGKKWVTATNVKGWPDLFLWHEKWERAVAAELKSERGVASPEQLECLASLAAAGIETYVWRPSDWDALEAVLRGGRPG
jgi:hypothetical protein